MADVIVPRTRINHDIVHNIAEWSSSRSLCALCLVSKSTCSAARPVLFRYVTIGLTYDWSYDGLLELLQSRPDLARHVRILDFGEHFYGDQLGDYIAAVPNITMLKIDAPHKELVPLTHSLSMLQDYHVQSLSIRWCNHECVDDFLYTIPPVQHFNLYFSSRMIQSRTTGLESVLIRSRDSLKTLCIEDSDLLDEVLLNNPSATWPHVHRLQAAWNSHTLRAFPNIRSLCFPPQTTIDEYYGLLNSNALPQLEFIHIGRPMLRGDFDTALPRKTAPTRKREIRSVSLDFEYREFVPFIDLEHLTTLSLTLGKPPDFKTAFAPLSSCRTLQHLGLTMTHNVYSMYDLCDELISVGELPDLKCLCINRDETEPADQIRIGELEQRIPELVEHYPRLKAVEYVGSDIDVSRRMRLAWCNRWLISNIPGVRKTKVSRPLGSEDMFALSDFIGDDWAQLCNLQILQ